MFHHLFNDFYKKKPAASSQSHMKTTEKNMCLVFFKVVSIITWNISKMCTFVRNRRINLVIFYMHKKENIWTFVYWFKSLKGRQCNYWNETNWWCYCTTGLSVELSSIFNWNSCILHVAIFMWYFHCSICRILIVFR